MKKIFCIIVSLFIFCMIPHSASADFSFGIGGFGFDIDSVSALTQLQKDIVAMTKKIHIASSSMMKFGHMLICNAVHGEASYWSADIAGVASVTLHLVCIDTIISGALFYTLGFFVMVMASFYLFDVAFNLSIAIILLPIGLALWPFAWTRDKLKKIIEAIVYYTGIFMFLPLGVLISVQVLKEVVDTSFEKDGFDFLAAFAQDESDLLRDHLGIFSIGFLAVLLCYVVALKVIPLMACEFCTHFFGNALIGNPIKEKLDQAMQVAKERTVDKAKKYGKDVAKHQAGKGLENLGNKNGNFMQRIIARAGKNLAKTKKGK